MTYNKEKRQATIIARYGSLEAYKQMLREKGAIGGKKGKRELTTEEAKRIGKLGREKRYGKQ